MDWRLAASAAYAYGFAPGPGPSNEYRRLFDRGQNQATDEQ